jgi:hypothetical protein
MDGTFRYLHVANRGTRGSNWLAAMLAMGVILGAFG